MPIDCSISLLMIIIVVIIFMKMAYSRNDENKYYVNRRDFRNRISEEDEYFLLEEDYYEEEENYYMFSSRNRQENSNYSTLSSQKLKTSQQPSIPRKIHHNYLSKHQNSPLDSSYRHFDRGDDEEYLDMQFKRGIWRKP